MTSEIHQLFKLFFTIIIKTRPVEQVIYLVLFLVSFLHSIAENMAPSVLVWCSRTSMSTKSWRVEDFVDVLVREVRGTLGGLYPSSFLPLRTFFTKFVCKWSPQRSPYLWRHNLAWSRLAGARVKTEMESTWNFGSSRLLVTVFW